MEEIENGLIESTMLGMEDHGCMSCWLNLSFSGTGQGFGGYALDGFRPNLNRRVGTAWGLEFIKRTMDVVGVEKWESLKGKYVRVKRRERRGPIVAIGNIVADKWFEPKADLAFLEKEA